MKPEPAKPRFNRRSFLKRTALLGGFAAAVLAGEKPALPSPPVPANAAGQGKGYRLTPHVRKYYETAAS